MPYLQYVVFGTSPPPLLLSPPRPLPPPHFPPLLLLIPNLYPSPSPLPTPPLYPPSCTVRVSSPWVNTDLFSAASHRLLALHSWPFLPTLRNMMFANSPATATFICFYWRREGEEYLTYFKSDNSRQDENLLWIIPPPFHARRGSLGRPSCPLCALAFAPPSLTAFSVPCLLRHLYIAFFLLLCASRYSASLSSPLTPRTYYVSFPVLWHFDKS